MNYERESQLSGCGFTLLLFGMVGGAMLTAVVVTLIVVAVTLANKWCA